MPTCQLCGRCCHYVLNGTLKRCKHLVKLSSGKTLCRVYKTRLDTLIDINDVTGEHIICHLREDIRYNYVGCPFNRVGWDDFDGG